MEVSTLPSDEALDSGDIVQKYWDQLPQEMRIELLHNGKNQKEILERASTELGVDFETQNDDAHLRKEDIAAFAVSVMEKFGERGERDV